MKHPYAVLCLGALRYVAYSQLYAHGVSPWWFVVSESVISTMWLMVRKPKTHE